MSEVRIQEAASRLDLLVKQAAAAGERVVFLDEDGEPAAVLLSVTELEDIEDDLALAKYQLAEERGTLETESHEEVVRAVYGGDEARSRGAE